MAIRKAVITAAGRGGRLYPVADTVHKNMLPLVDRDGRTKPVIQIIVEEALESGIEEIGVVCAPGDEERYRTQLSRLRDNPVEGNKGADWARKQSERIDEMLRRLRFYVQEEPLGYGHAVYCAKDFVGDAPFLLLLGDHLYISAVAGRRCAEQLIQLAGAEDCAVAAVNPTPEHLVPRYGTLSGKRVQDMRGVYEIERIVEKPALSKAELELQTPGLRIGHYLCLFGMHVLTPRIFDYLEALLREEKPEGGYQLTSALQELANRETYLAAELRGVRYDIGAPFGLLYAQVALGMAGEQRDEMLAGLVELMASAASTRAAE